MSLSPILQDILPLLISDLDDDCDTLYCLCQVNRLFSHEAAKALYRRIVVSPPSRGHVLDLRRRPPPNPAWLVSSCLPKYAGFVRELEVSGFITSLSSRSTIGEQLYKAVQAYDNLETVIISPRAQVSGLFVRFLDALLGGGSVRNLTAGAALVYDSLAELEPGDGSIPRPRLADLRGLQSLTLLDPNRAILQALPEWLEHMISTLTELRLQGNCGSITPGVLRSFVPHVQGLRSFALGLSYSLMHEDIYHFLGNVPQLRFIELQYHWQIRVPQATPRLPNMVHFAIKHPFIFHRQEADALCKWIRRTATSSPLEDLRLLTDMADEPSLRSPSPSHDALVRHLCARHARTLRVLHIRACFVGRQAFVDLCTRCTRLEVLAVAVPGSVLGDLSVIVGPLQRLRTLTIETRNMKPRKVRFGLEDAVLLFHAGPKSLCKVSINGVTWRATWKKEDGVMTRAAEQISQRQRPWERADAYY